MENTLYRQLDFIVDLSEDKLSVLDILRKNSVSRRLIISQKRVENGILRNGENVFVNIKVSVGDVISIRIPIDKTSSGIVPNENLEVPIAYEDEDVVIFEKPVNMPTHPSIKHFDDTLANFFAVKFPELKFRPINRLDKDTSGLCAVAKNPHFAKILQASLKKKYYAIVCGKIENDGRISAPIARADETIIRREVREDGQYAVTNYKVLQNYNDYTLLEIELETGRTHQIRVHFSYKNYPLAGDDFYGGSTKDIKKTALHCGELQFFSILKNDVITVKSEIREDMKNLVNFP